MRPPSHSNVAAGGGVAGIIGLVAPGEPFEGGFGGGDPSIPGYMISQADSNRVKSGLTAGVVVRFDPAVGIPLVRHMVGSSSRGAAMSDNIIKPEIGAPGASISAVAGSGTGTESFGGTSGAAPMVAGAAALLKQAHPGRTIYELKAALVNTAETNIRNRAAFGGGPLAPITRIGGGEVRVDRALVSPLAAYEAETGAPTLSFAFHEVSQTEFELSKWVAVRNYSLKNVKLRVSSDFRFADDETNGAIKVQAPSTVEVPANDWGYFEVKVVIDGAKLRTWNLNSGGLGASGDALTAMEYDGYIYMTDTSDGANRIQLPWQVLPRKAGNVTLRNLEGADVQVRNRGVATTTVESYSLIGARYNLPEGGPGEQNPTPDFHYLGYATYPVPAGFCSANESFLMAFAVNTWERQTHANAPLSIEIYLDTNQDGQDDYLVINRDLSLNSLTDGRNVVWSVDLSSGDADVFFFTNHNTNSGNTVLTICGEQIGMNAANFGQPIDLNAYATDIYFTGEVTDKIEGVTIAPLGERYLGVFEEGGVGFSDIGFQQNDVLTVVDTGSRTNNTEFGLLLLYRPGAPVGAEAGVVIVR
ncbi:MAG: S8 family serine peptidase [Caldilinea sp.]